jgi:hypothetical protein
MTLWAAGKAPGGTGMGIVCRLRTGQPLTIRENSRRLGSDVATTYIGDVRRKGQKSEVCEIKTQQLQGLKVNDDTVLTTTTTTNTTRQKHDTTRRNA